LPRRSPGVQAVARVRRGVVPPPIVVRFATAGQGFVHGLRTGGCRCRAGGVPSCAEACVAKEARERRSDCEQDPPADRHEVVHGTPAFRERLQVVTSAAHPLAARSRVTLDEVGRLAALLLRRWWYQRSRRELEALGRLPEPVLAVPRSRWSATPCSRATPRRSSRPASLRTRSPPVRSYRCRSPTCQRSCVTARSSSTTPPTTCPASPSVRRPGASEAGDLCVPG
jgi:hypothetical protein